MPALIGKELTWEAIRRLIIIPARYEGHRFHGPSSKSAGNVLAAKAPKTDIFTASEDIRHTTGSCLEMVDCYGLKESKVAHNPSFLANPVFKTLPPYFLDKLAPKIKGLLGLDVLEAFMTRFDCLPQRI